jgi:hypothetical protein
MSDMFYVLMETGFEYNDENYFRHDGSGGHPEKVFTDKERAEEAAFQKGLEFFKRLVASGEIKDYGYGLEDILVSDVLEDDLLYEEGMFMSVFGMTAEDWWSSLYDRNETKVVATDEQWKKLYNCFSLNFYEVVAVEKG